MKTSKIYKSGKVHDIQQAHQYSQTHRSPHRFLAYRDFSHLIENFKNIKRVLDLGSGTGASSQFLFHKGFDVVGADKSKAMTKEARSNFPHISFLEIENLNSLPLFDLVFSSFVLFELATKKEIINYLNLAASSLKNGGIFFGITGSENLHQSDREWMCFNVNYEENLSLNSGDVVKLGLKEPDIEFQDYFWNESDYRECFQLSGLELIQIYYPLGLKEESFKWKDELSIAPFVIFLAKKVAIT